MENNEDLAKLEQFVEKLIESHNQLKNENNEINSQLQSKQQEVIELQETIKGLQKDRSLMHGRVTGLIDRIDEWEKTFDSGDSGQSGSSEEGQAQNLSKKSSSLFNVTTEQSSESAL